MSHNRPTDGQSNFINEIRSQRIHPNGTKKLNSLELPWGLFETVEATNGCFSAVYKEFAFVYTRKPSYGQVQVNTDFKVTSINKVNQLSLFCPKDSVSGVFSDPVTYDILLINNDYFTRIIETEFSFSIEQISYKLRENPHILIERIWTHLLSSLNSPKSTETLEQLLSVFIISYFSLQVKNVLLNPKSRCSNKISAAIHFIKNNIEKKISVTELAHESGLSKFHFIRAFRNITGINPYQYILNRRLEISRELLENDNKSIAEIAHECGFNSQSHLTTCFKKAYQKTPAKYRYEKQKKPTSNSNVDL